jgi:hypothetical protein
MKRDTPRRLTRGHLPRAVAVRRLRTGQMELSPEPHDAVREHRRSGSRCQPGVDRERSRAERLVEYDLFAAADPPQDLPFTTEDRILEKIGFVVC